MSELKTAATVQASKLTRREKLFESSKKVIRYINRTHGMRFQLVQRFSGGYQSGAYLLESPEGEKAVLKWNNKKSKLEKMEQAAATIKLAKEFGWPTPAWLAWGITPSGYPYQVQEFASGTHRERVDMILVKDALRVIELQAGKAPLTDQNWTTFDRSVIYGEHDDVLKRISQYSESGKDFIALLTEKLEPFRNVLIPDNDIVHGDFHQDNAFMTEDKITGLIDAESIGKGSRFHDVTTLMIFILLFDGESTAMESLLDYARENATPGEFEVCLAANLVNLLTMFLRKPSDRGEQKIAKSKEFLLSVM